MKLKTKFQDENFKLGEVVDANIYFGGSGRFKVVCEAASGGIHSHYFNSLKELNEQFEDCEEPKVAYWIDSQGDICVFSDTKADDWSKEKTIGNYFETKEEAERAVEKLKAWKRLKDKGFRFGCWYGGSKLMSFSIPQEIIDKTTTKDLDLLFGGEE